MRGAAGAHIVRPIAGHRGGATARRRRAAVAAAAFALPLTAVTLTAAPASAAVRYMVTHTIHVGGFAYGVAVDPAARTAYATNVSGNTSR